MRLHLITPIRQVDGGVRYLLMTSARRAREWREKIAADPAMVEACRADYVVDEHRGRLICSDWPRPASQPLTPDEWVAIRAAVNA